jgi:hypothetical protein
MAYFSNDLPENSGFTNNQSILSFYYELELESTGTEFIENSWFPDFRWRRHANFWHLYNLRNKNRIRENLLWRVGWGNMIY